MFFHHADAAGHPTCTPRFLSERNDIFTPCAGLKSWFELCGHNSVDNGFNTGVQTVQLCFCSLLTSFNSQQHYCQGESHDIIQAYAQAGTALHMHLYDTAPTFLNLV